MNSATILRGRTVFAWFVVFFGIIIAVDVAMVTLAIRTNTGLVTTRPYEKGIAYNKVVEAANAQAALGWKAEIIFGNAILDVTLREASGRVLHPESMVAEFTRPTQSGMDFRAPMEKKQGAESFVLVPQFPEKGLWEVRIYASVNGHKFQQAKRIVVE